MTTQWFPIENYSMKCRLYPTKKQAEKIDTWIHAIHAVHNMILYDIRENLMYTKEIVDKEDTNKVAHFPVWSEAFKSASLMRYRAENEIVQLLPGGAITDKNCGLKRDMWSAWNNTGKHPIEQWGQKYINKKGERIMKGVRYYSKNKPRRSFGYYTAVSNICETKNHNVITVRIASRADEIGHVKVRGWNQQLRFDEAHQIDFMQWIQSKAKRQIMIKISKDKCGDYWIVFLLPLVYKPIKVPATKHDVIGIDVGEITLATLSDGSKIENVFDYNPRILDEKATLMFYHRKLSRSQGWMNPKFRNAKMTEPSNGYQSYIKKLQRLERKIQRQRKDYYNKVSAAISVSADCIGIEGLRVKDMYYRK